MTETQTIDREARTQAARRDESERRLLEATLTLIVRDGVSAATFDRIGQAAGYSRGLASHRFGSKEGLVRALIDFLNARRDEVVDRLNLDHVTGLEALLTYAGAHFDEMAAKPDVRAYFTLLAAAVADLSEIRAAFAQSHERAKATLEGYIARGQREGVIARDVDAGAASLMVGSALMGVAMQAIVDPAFDHARVRDETLRMIRTGLGVTQNEGDAR